MAQKDWEEVRNIIEFESPGFFEDFLASDQTFLPNDSLLNPFNADHSNFMLLILAKVNLDNGYLSIISRIFLNIFGKIIWSL